MIPRAAIILAAMTLAACGGGPAAALHSGRVVALGDSLQRAGGADTLRFGRLSEGETAVQRLSLRNDADRPMVVVGHETTCGCVTVEYDRRPVMPGESLPVTFTFDSRGEYGWQMKPVTLRLGSGAVPFRIYVEAEVE